MKILVTGGAGFIGSHLVDSYIAAGHNVVVVDNLSTGSKKNLNLKAKFYKTDIQNHTKIDAIFQRERPHIINHHAALIEVTKSFRDPIATFNVNVTGTVNILLASGKYNIKKFIFSSTGGAIYGNPVKIPADENTKPSPLSPYGLSKHLSELCIKYYADLYGFEYCILRYPNVYGPRQNFGGEAGVVAIFSNLMKRNIAPIIFGDGTKTRDYVYVGDIARANLLALRRGRNETMNLGRGKEISDQEVFDTIAKHTDFNGKPKYAPFREGEVRKISITNGKAKKVLGWKPEVEFKEGVRKTIETI